MRKVMDEPHTHVVPVNGAKLQYAKGPDTSAKLGPNDKLFAWQVIGTFLYYARAVDLKMVVSLSAIASDKMSPTKEIMRKTLQFLNYVATQT